VTIFSPEDGQRLGLAGMINTIVRDCDTALWESGPADVHAVLTGERSAVARAITGAEAPAAPASRPSPTSSCDDSGWTSRTSCASP
jgi:methylmalonyl-CoA mutase